MQENALHQGAFQRALAEVQQGVQSIASAAEQSRSLSGQMNTQMVAIKDEITQTGRSLSTAIQRSESVLKVSEHLVELVSTAGVQTEDCAFVEAAVDAVGRSPGCLSRPWAAASFP